MKTDRLDLRHREDSGEYTVPGHCSNCGWSGTLVLTLGSEAPRGYRAERCKVCGCKTVTSSVRAAA